MRSKFFLSAAVLMASLASAQEKPAQAPPKPKDTPPVQAPAADTLVIHRSSQILGAKVQNPQREDLGKIEELVIDPSTGAIEYAVLSFGGFAGMGDKLFALPWQTLKPMDAVEPGGKEQRFQLNVEKVKLEKAPGFPKNNWPDMASPAWCQEIDRYYGSVRTNDPNKAVEMNQQFKILRLSELRGKDIKNDAGDKLGDFKEFAIDPRAGRVNYFVMTSGGFLGLGDKLFAVPWEALKVKLDQDKLQFLLPVPKEKFERAPEFKDDDWVRMSDPVWVVTVYDYYGHRPYWRNTAEAKAPRDAKKDEKQPKEKEPKEKDGR